jgi:ATP-dependent helicase/DNAse subunit B
MVKFDREQVQASLSPGDSIEVMITGQVNGIDFEGTDTIRVIDKGKEHTSNDASSVVY